MISLLQSLTLLPLLVSSTTAFGGFDPALISHSVSSATTAFDSLIHHHHHHHHVASVATAPPLDVAQHLLNSYKNQLAVHPLPTKMITGATLSMTGDAIAQSKEEGPYDARRAASFGTFDMAYRALQHVSFPWIVEHCRGQIFTAALSGVLASTSLSTTVSITPELTQNFAAMEQTLASQLGIVPFLYYPVFFGLTGYMQGLTATGSVERAQEKFLPLMQRNLLFWIPMQFIQFGFIEESLQIPFLSVCGLAWTFILSVMAGSTKNYQESSEDDKALVDQGVVLPATNDEEPIFQPSQLDALGAAMVEATASNQTPDDFVMTLPEEEEEPLVNTGSAKPSSNTGFAYEQQ